MLIGPNIICRNNLHVCIPKNPKFNLYYILGVLNARVTDFVYSFLNPEKGEALAEVKKAHVEMLPVPVASREMQIKVANIVEQVIEDKAKGLNTEEKEKEINSLICSLYSLTEKEKSLVEAAYVRD